MDQKNLDIYGHEPIPWSRPLAGAGEARVRTWLKTSWFLRRLGQMDGRTSPGVGAVWFDGKFYIVSGPGTRKSRNLAENPNCVDLRRPCRKSTSSSREQRSGSRTMRRSSASSRSTTTRDGRPK